MTKICIDAGHGLKTVGKRNMKILDGNETREWYLNDRIADKLERLLSAYDCEVLRTDDTTGLTDVSLTQRVTKANNYGADVFISIHHNAGINGGAGGGTVVYYHSSKVERRAQAQRLYNAVVNQTRLVGNRSSQVIKKSSKVIRDTTMPAFLIENGFMDSKTDVPIILTEEHANKTAQGVLDFLVSEYEIKRIADEPQETFKVRVRVDALSYRDGAGIENKINGTITDNGVYTIVETAIAEDGGTWGKLKSGGGWINIGGKYVSRV